MDNDIIQAYLWQDVINLGFSPKSPKEMKKWLSAYGRSLREFWGIYEDPKNPVDKKGKIEGTIHYSEINILFDYSISPNPATIPKFTITLFYCSNTNDLMWVHDFDDQYFSFPIQSILSKYGKEEAFRYELKQFSKKNSISEYIETVLNGMIFHPRVHQHIESPVTNHEIRVGGGIDNPFLEVLHM